MAASEITVIIETKRTWKYYPCFWLAFFGYRLGFCSEDQAAEFFVRHAFKIGFPLDMGKGA